MLHRWFVYLRSLRHRSRRDRELQEEIAFHLSEEADEQAEAGLTIEEARIAARRDFGSVSRVREAAREIWSWGSLERLIQDIRSGVRWLRAAPVVSTVAILSLALGIGANTAVFSILDGLLLRSLPVHDPHRLALIEGGAGRRTHWTNPIWEQIRDRRSMFDSAFAWSSTRFNLARTGETDFVDGVWMSGGMFAGLGVPAMLGRTLTEGDDQRGGGPDGAVAVISHDFWQRRFGGTADVIGQSLTVERVPFTIVGVAPPRFFGAEVGRTFDVAIPIGTATLINGPEVLERRSAWWLRVMVRLRPGQDREAASAALASAYPQIREATLPPHSPLSAYMPEGFGLFDAANGSSDLRGRYQRPVTIIMVVAGLVLLIACANIANLLLARAMARRAEFSLRVALGASRLRIARQLLTESLLLSLVGALLGLIMAWLGSDVLVSQLSTATNQVFLDLTLNGRVLAFTMGMAVLTCVLFGVAPALRGTRAQPHEALKAQGRGVAGDAHLGLGHMLVVLQVALSLVLIVAAGLFLRTFSSLARLDLGFNKDAVLIASVNVPREAVDPAERPELFRRLIEAALAVPGAESVALSELTPVNQSSWNNYIEMPDGPPITKEAPITYFNLLSPGWFLTYGTTMIAGRDFMDSDTRGAPLVAIVNETFARHFAGGRNPIGMRVREPAVGNRPHIDREIVGYVRDAVYESPRQPVPPTLYLPYSQWAELPTSTSISVRAAGGSPARLVSPLAAALTQVHGDLSLTFRPLADQVDAALTQERVVGALSGLFGALALLLVGLGLYGVTAYGVSRRRTEIGIRMALGAAPAGVVALVLRRVATLVVIGIAIGLAASLWASQFVSTLLHGLPPRDPATVAAAAAVLAAIAALAGWLPARRASRIDPARVLREG